MRTKDYYINRNNQIYYDYKNTNLSYADLGQKYKITKDRVYKIVKSFDNPKQEINKKENPKVQNGNGYKNVVVNVKQSDFEQMSGSSEKPKQMKVKSIAELDKLFDSEVSPLLKC